MRKSRFTEEQIIGILKEKAAGVKVADLCRHHGVSEHTLYRWQSKYGGMDVAEARGLKQLEDENRRLKQLVADRYGRRCRSSESACVPWRRNAHASGIGDCTCSLVEKDSR